MKQAPYMKHVLIFCQVLLLLSVIPACSQDKSNLSTESKSLSVGTGVPGGSYHLTGLAISRIVNSKQEVHGFRLQEEFSSGSVSNIDAILAGDIQFGIAQSDRQYQAFNGLAEWEERGPQKDLRALFSLYPESVTLVASGHSNITAINDLRDKRVDIGLPGSGARQNAIDVLDAAGIEWESDIKAHEEKLDKRINMLMHGRVDAFFHTVGHPSQDIKSATFLVGGILFIPPANIENILSEKPYYSKSFIPMELYPFAINKEDVETIGVRATLLTSAKVPDDIVYAVTKAVFDDLESLGYYSHVLKRTVRKENMLGGLTAPIHPGALRFYQEIGLKLPTSSY